MRSISWVAFVVFVMQACQPARSDVYEEMVNATLLQNLINRADSVEILLADSQSVASNPVWIAGKKLFMDGGNTITTIWYDEQDRPTGLVEYVNNRLKDSIMFYPNGQRMFTFLFDKEGRISGPARYYYPDGRVREDGRFEKGIQTGIWREFSAEGKLITTHEYDRYGQKKR